MKQLVGFSGGIDSQACAGWVPKRLGDEDTIIVDSDVGGDEDAITTHVEWCSENVHPVVMLSIYEVVRWVQTSKR